MLSSMQLLSPPATSHREEKENRHLVARVSWSQENRVHPLTSPPSAINIKPSASYEPPSKSILRKVTSFPFTDVPHEVERDITPEPGSPLLDASYLANPVSKIVSVDATLNDLIQAYNILAARIRTSASSNASVDASKPLFLPLRDNAEAFVRAVVRDLERVMVDPNESKGQEYKSSLPSPRPSPSKRKRGMGEEQVKHARDLATTTHSVIKLLALLFSSALCQIFSDDQLGSMLTQLLAIPMADELPTPNSRKTCALSIWVLQIQRLPATVLDPAKDRIAYALRRGMEGELGKEGKKGSTSDGLKAVHDLSIHEPSIFVPKFTDLLPSILANLLAPTLPLRVQACHALAGFVIGLTALPLSYLHTRVSNAVATFLLTPTNSPTKSLTQESTIVRTFRTLLNNQEPLHPAQGPVWALSVMACFLVMLGPRAYTDSQLSRTFSAQCSLAMRHKKSSVRALGCLLWRCITWVYFQPPLLARDPDTAEEGEEEGEESSSKEQESPSDGDDSGRHSWWKLVQGVIDMGAGTSTIIGLLAESRSSSSSEGLAALIRILSLMIRKGGPTCVDALQIIKKLIPPAVGEDGEEQCSADQEEWGWVTLIPKALFCSYPGLLSVDFKGLSAVVKPIFDECLGTEDVRCFTQEELAGSDVFKGLVRVWRESLRALEIEGHSKPPQEMLEIWKSLLRAKLDQVKDSTSDARTFAEQVSSLLLDIISDPQIRPSPTSDLDSDELPTPTSSPSKPSSSSRPPSRSNSALKIFLIRHLWTVAQSVLPSELLHVICPELLSYLKQHHALLVPATDLHRDGEKDTKEQWGLFCAEILTECGTSSVEKFLGSTKIFRQDLKQAKRWATQMRGLGWRNYAMRWMEMEEEWEEGISVLLLPIVSSNEPWTLIDDDIKTWEKVLSFVLSRALDNGAEPHSVLEQIASRILQQHTATWSSATRIVDLIVSDLDVTSSKEVPMEVMELANYTLVSSYPPEPRNKVLSSWLIRSVTRIVDECPVDLATQVLEKIQEGLSLWISDEYKVFTPEEYEFDMVISYQTILVVIQNQAQSPGILESFEKLIGSAFRGRLDKPSATLEAFQEFWRSSYGDVAAPAHGWPAAIRESLLISFPSNQNLSERDISTRADQELIANLAQDVLGVSSTDMPDARAISSEVLVDHSENITNPTAPATPQTSKKQQPVTPPRRQKVTSSPSRLLNVNNRSPLMDVRHVPALPLYTPPAETKGDKENLNPTSTSFVTESASVSVLGKRKLGEAIDDSVIYVKRRKNGSQGSAHRKQHGPAGGNIRSIPYDPGEPDLTSFGETSPTTAKASTASKKRKVEFMDAVVVPTYRQIIKSRRRTSGPSKLGSSASALSIPVSPPHIALRRARSATKLVGEGGLGPLLDLPRKKLRVAPSDDRDSNDSESSLHDIQVAGSDDSIMLANPGASQELPSDDDPVKLGNLTPHLVVSPSLGARRMDKDWDESDPASDDSVGPESPSKQLVERRQQRFWNTPRGTAPGGRA